MIPFLYGYVVGGLVSVLFMELLSYLSNTDEDNSTIGFGSAMFIILVWPLVIVDFVQCIFGRGPRIANWISRQGRRFFR